MKDKNLVLILINIIIYIFISIFSIYNGFIKEVEEKIAWIILTILIFIALLIRLFLIRKDNKLRKKSY